jgi:hypothetical protein
LKKRKKKLEEEKKKKRRRKRERDLEEGGEKKVGREGCETTYRLQAHDDKVLVFVKHQDRHVKVAELSNSRDILISINFSSPRKP